MRPKQIGLILLCSVILANAYEPDQLLRRAVALTGGPGPNRSTFSARRTSESDGNAEVSAGGKIDLWSSEGQGTHAEKNLTATEHGPGPKWLDAAPTEMYAVFSKQSTEDEADAQAAPKSSKKSSKDSGGMPWKTIILAIIVIALLVFFGPAIYAALFAPKALPGRLNEVSRESADQNVWASSKARQTYRKSVLAAQSAKDTSESEEGGPPNSSPSLKVPERNSKRAGVSISAAAARRYSAAPPAPSAAAGSADLTAEESGSDTRPRSPSIRSTNTVGTTGTGGGSYKNRRKAPPAS